MAFLRNEKGQIIRKDGSLVPRAVNRRGPGKDRASHLKVDRILGGQGPLRAEYEKLMDTPGVYLRHLQAFLAERGHHVSLSGVKTHRTRYREEFKSLRHTARAAEAFCRMRDVYGGDAMAAAAQGRIEMLVMQDVFELKEKSALGAEQWQRWMKALDAMVATRRTLDLMREENERKAKEVAKEMEALDPMEVGRRVSDRVRKILGIDLPSPEVRGEDGLNKKPEG